MIKRFICLLSTLMAALPAAAQVYNLKVVTDANPDYFDLPSLVYSATSKWETPKEKCWAMFYWNHIARRQTMPIELHGMAHTDPIRQFNDYGYTMCSTISGINQSIWEAMGLKHRYWDISNHTVCEVFYDDAWHCYDNSLSALYTLCDGKTIAGVADIGKKGACEASGGKEELGHIARYHCLTATSPRGFLSGADTARSLDEEFRCFNPNGLKLRKYFYDWEYGHRYILNVRPGERYMRLYAGQADQEGTFVPNNGKDPEKKNVRYHIRGNGTWMFVPQLTAPGLKAAYSASGVVAVEGGLAPEKANEPGEVVYRVSSANVTTSMKIDAQLKAQATDKITIAVSTDNGLHYKDVLPAGAPAQAKVSLNLVEPVNGAYETLVRIRMTTASAAQMVLQSLSIQTTTAINSKTQPKLKLGKNMVYVGAGEQTDSIVFWPELQSGKHKEMVVEEKNIASTDKHPGYMGTIYPAEAKEDAYVVYRIDAPHELTKVTYGGRFYNRAPKSHIDLLHSFDGGKTWTKSWTVTDTAMPWDVIHYETVAAPAGVKSVLIKYLMNTTEPKCSGCSIYSVRMEANYKPVQAQATPLAMTFTWNEVQKDRSVVQRSHTQVVEELPATYTINVGGEDHPVMQAMEISGLSADQKAPAIGYSDGKDAGGEKFVGYWQTLGNNLATGKKYTMSHPSTDNWGAGDPDGNKLTDGVAGPPYAGGISFKYGVTWKPSTNPTITLDLGSAQACASFGLNANGYPWWDALKGQIKDKIEVLVSADGLQYTSVGFLYTDLKWKDLPANYMWTDEETFTGGTYRLIPEKPVTARFVQYKITSPRNICVTELEVLDSITRTPFDLRVALPK